MHMLIFHIISFGCHTCINLVVLFEHISRLFASLLRHLHLLWAPAAKPFSFHTLKLLWGRMAERRSLWQVEIVSPHLPSAVVSVSVPPRGRMPHEWTLLHTLVAHWNNLLYRFIYANLKHKNASKPSLHYFINKLLYLVVGMSKCNN